MVVINVANLNTKGSKAPEAVRALILEHNIHVIGLQEIDVNAERSGRRNVAHEIAGGHGHYAFGESMRFGYLNPADTSPDISYKAPASMTASDARYGVALVSAHGFKRRQKVFLGPGPQNYWSIRDRYAQREHEPRSAIFGALEIGGIELWVMSTHLAHTSDRGQSSPVRAAQLENLMRHIEIEIPPEAPFIAMLDANATPGNPDMREFMRGFQKAADVLTHPVGEGKSPRHQIDYILSRNVSLRGAKALAFSHWDHVVQIASYELTARADKAPLLPAIFRPHPALRAEQRVS